MASTLQVVILKPSKYLEDGVVERFQRGFMPNSTVPHMRSMVPADVDGVPVETYAIDEYVHTDLQYLKLLKQEPGKHTLVALVGVQSHQFQRALDLAAYARKQGCMTVIGGPHVMTCDTSMLHGRGVSFALSEAELIWPQILQDAMSGELQPTYGTEQRWEQNLKSPVLTPPSLKDLKRYVMPMMGVYPARGCPFLCNFCSVTQIAGRKIRSQSVATTMASLKAAKAGGVNTIMFTSDNFNKYPDAEELLNAMVEAKLGMKFFVQCDTQIARQEQLVELMARAGCFQMFVGVESFNRKTLLAARKGQNRPEKFQDIVRLCREHGIGSHFSNIIGFPEDTEQGIHEHLETLQQMAPAWASFYILCPIPGTEQYDDFLEAGLINELNLDRFDTTCLTWRHPCLSAQQLSGLLFECYRKFYSLRHTLQNARNFRTRSGDRRWADQMGAMSMSLFVRYCAWQRRHPMSGGVRRVRRDCSDDYRSLRKSTFDFDLVPLPKSLKIPVEQTKQIALPESTHAEHAHQVQALNQPSRTG